MNKYDDIINLPHHVSKYRTHMSISQRASQFAPFSALTGYNDAIKEKSKEILIEILNAKYNLNLSNTESNNETQTTKETDSKGNSKIDSSQSSNLSLQLSSSMEQAYNNLTNQTEVKVAGE